MSLKAVFKEEAPVKADLGEIVTGLAATVSVGTVTDGETASVVNSGTAQNAKLDFVLPRGAKGDPGGVVSFNGRTGTVMPEKGDYTADQVGAAPSGFGWGERVAEAKAASAQESHEDYCAKLDAILSNMTDATAALIIAYPPEIYGRAATTISILYKGSDEYATLFNCGAAEPFFNGWRMYKEKGVWSPFEWVNPPMKLGVEYRTTERWDQKPVYCIAWPGGAFPNNTNKTVEVDTGTPGSVKAVFSYAVLGNGTMVNGILGDSQDISGYLGMFLQNSSTDGKFLVQVGSKRTVENTFTIFIKYTRG